MARLIAKYRAGPEGERIFKGWYGRWYDRDRRPPQKELAMGTTDEQLARMKLAQLELREVAGDWDPWRDSVPRDGVMLSMACDQYVKERERKARFRELSPKTVRGDRSVLDLFAARTPIGIAVGHIQPEHVTDFLRSCDLRESSYNTYLARLSGFFAWCHKRGIVRENPIPSVNHRSTAGTRGGSFPYLTRPEFKRLLQVIDQDAGKGGLKKGEVIWFRDVVTVMVGTGTRPGELAALQWHWITDLGGEAPFLHVKVREDEFIPKWRMDRSIPLAGAALEVLRRLYASSNGEGYVFRSRRNRKGDAANLNVEYLSTRFLHYRREAKLPKSIKLYSLRHTYASWLVIAGVDLYRVQRLLGHRSIETTMRYAHLAPHDLRGAVEHVFGGSGL